MPVQRASEYKTIFPTILKYLLRLILGANFSMSSDKLRLFFWFLVSLVCLSSEGLVVVVAVVRESESVSVGGGDSATSIQEL